VVVPNLEARNPAGLLARGVTHVSIVPTQLIDWLRDEDVYRLTEMAAILVGGAATPSFVREDAARLHLPVFVSYGSTEMASQVATAVPSEIHEAASYVGRVLPHRQVRIREGEIQVAGKTRFAGYWSESALLRPFDEDGWFSTGDLGALDGDRLSVFGRRDNMFISGGENVYPEEIEDAILGTGLVTRAVVVSVANRRYGARPVAFIRPFVSVESLKSSLIARLPKFKIPDRFEPLPSDMQGQKPDRGKLARLAMDDSWP
jgi:O-succinylbenzoic acid--CoA ligase